MQRSTERPEVDPGVNDPRADQELAAALDACLRAMGGGEPLDAVLQRFPDQRAALLPLLHVARAVRAAPGPPPLAPSARQAIRSRMLARLESLEPTAQTASASPAALPLVVRRRLSPRWRIAALRGVAAVGLV